MTVANSAVTKLTDLAPPIWVGETDLAADPVDLVVPPRYAWARILVRLGDTVGEPVLVPVRDGRVSVAAVRRAASPWSTTAVATPRPAAPAGVSVGITVATHGRPRSLARTLASLRRAPGDVRILVVDNAPSDDAAQRVVHDAARRDPRVRYRREPRQGLSVARNLALREIGTDVLLFTDDDVEVDPSWILQHAAAFADPAVDVTSGPAFAARLDVLDEMLSESLVAWSKGPVERTVSMAVPPPDSPIFPFSPGILGGGLNFGVRVAAARRAGGFDESLGAGSPLQGGEDCDFFIRMIRQGATLRYRPAAFVWHHHRHAPGDFARQQLGSATGLGAYLAKLALDPTAVAQIAARLPAGVRHLVGLRRSSATAGVDAGQRSAELRAMAAGAVRCPLIRGRVRAAGGHVADRPL